MAKVGKWRIAVENENILMSMSKTLEESLPNKGKILF